MERGYYWLILKDEATEAVEIDGERMYRCGSDVAVILKDGRWIEFGEELCIDSIVGPITPTGSRMTALQIIEEWERGCSCAEPGKPEQCEECTREMVKALKRRLVPQLGGTLPSSNLR